MGPWMGQSEGEPSTEARSPVMLSALLRWSGRPVAMLRAAGAVERGAAEGDKLVERLVVALGGEAVVRGKRGGGRGSAAAGVAAAGAGFAGAVTAARLLLRRP